MQRYSFSSLATCFGLVALSSFLGVDAQAAVKFTLTPLPSAIPPVTCYARPLDEPDLVGVGLYWWYAPECAAARARWNEGHTKAALAMEGPPSAASLSMSASAPSSPTTEVDKHGLAFVTDGLAQLPRNLQSVWLPKGTLFPVHTMQSYSTFEARPYGKLRFELDEDVVVNGFLVAMKGDTAEGSFPNVMSGRSFAFIPISGSLFQISIDTVFNYCGDTIDVDFDRTEYRSVRVGPISGLIAPLIHNDMDQHIIRGQQYVSFTSRPQRVCGVPTSKSKAPVPAKALYPTTR